MSQNFENFSVLDARKHWYYRILEGSIGFVSFSFLILIAVFSYFAPTAVAIFLILYGFFWFIKVSLSSLYILYSFKTTLRFEKINWTKLLNYIEFEPDKALQELENYRVLGKKSDDWQIRISKDKERVSKIINTEWSKPLDIYHVIVLITYNEEPSILYKSLEAIYNNSPKYENVIVVLSQEERIGNEHNLKIQNDILELANGKFLGMKFQENDLNKVYSQNHNESEYKYESDFNLSNTKLNLFFTAHPDGLVGEIKGSGPNANWGARQGSLIVSHLNLDPKKVILTKLDADHCIGKNYLEVLTYNYITNEDRLNTGFEPIPVFVNNYYQTNFVPRIVGIQSTFWVMSQSILPEELHFYMCYAVPMHTLRDSGFWYKEVISEECFVFYQCFFHFRGNFKTIPIYAPIMVDAVEGLHFLDTFKNQYKQLQRWAWGAIEEFPYIFYKFFISKSKDELDSRQKIKITYLNFSNSVFWATSGLVFTLGVFLPKLLGGKEFNAKPISLSLQNISLFFTIFSFSLLGFFAYIIYHYLAPKIIENSVPNFTSKQALIPQPKSTKLQKIIISLEAALMPVVYMIIMPFPALDSQMRGILGKYLGYWVTPKGGSDQAKTTD